MALRFLFPKSILPVHSFNIYLLTYSAQVAGLSCSLLYSLHSEHNLIIVNQAKTKPKIICWRPFPCLVWHLAPDLDLQTSINQGPCTTARKAWRRRQTCKSRVRVLSVGTVGYGAQLKTVDASQGRRCRVEFEGCTATWVEKREPGRRWHKTAE